MYHKFTHGLCTDEEAILRVINDVPYTFDGKVFTVHENTAAGQAEGEAEFYGCLGFKVSDAQ